MNRQLLKSKINLDIDLETLIKSSKNQVIIFSPYLKLKALEKLLSNLNSRIDVTIITTWL